MTAKQVKASKEKALMKQIAAKLGNMIDVVRAKGESSTMVYLTDTEVSILKNQGYKVKRFREDYYEVIMP